MAAELSYGPYYQPSTGKFANSLPEIVGVSDIDNKPMYGNWVEGFTPVDVDNDPQFREYYSWTPTTFPNRPLAIALNRAADQSNFQAPYRGQILQMLESYAPIMGMNEGANWKQIFTDTQNRQFRTYGNWSTYDNPSQTFFKFLQWNGFPNAKEVQQYVQATPEYKKEAQSFTDAWNASNQSSGSFFDDLLGVGSIAVAFMFPQLAGFIGEAMGFGAAASTSAIVAGNAVMSAGVAAVEGKSPEQILTAAATGALGGIAQQAAIGSNSFLQSVMDAGLPWEVVQSMPKAGIGSLAGAVSSAIQGKDVLSGLVTGGSLSLLGGSVTNALTLSGVSPLAATAAAQGLNQLIMTGDINPEALAKNAALGIVDPQVSRVLQDAGVPTEAIPTAVRAVNQVLTTGDINAQSLALAATGQFAADQLKDLKGGLPSSSETTPVPTPEVIPSTPLAPETPAVTPTETQTAETPKGALEQATETTAPAVTQPVAPDGGLTQVATGPTTTDVPVQEKNWGEPGYVYPDGTVEPAAKPAAETTAEPTGGLPVDQTLVDAYVNPQTPTKEVTQQPVTYDPTSPTTPVATGDALLDQYLPPQTTIPEPTQTPVGGLPTSIEQQVADQETQAGYDTVPDVTNTDFPGALPTVTPSAPTVLDTQPSDPYSEAYPSEQPSDPYAGDPNALIPVTTDTGTVYVDPNTGDVASDPTQVVTDPYFTTNPSTADLGGNVGGLPTTPVSTPTTPQLPKVVGGLPVSGGSPTSAMNDMNKTLGLDSSQNFGDPSRRAYLSPVVLATQGGGKAMPTYAQLIPQLASILGQRGYATGGHVDVDQHFADILARRGYPVEMVPGPENRLYRRHMKRGFAVNGPGTGQSDDIPTMLADGEYVIDADTVAALGDGSTKAGSQVLDRFREQIRQHKRSAPVDKIPPKAKSPLEYLKAAQKGMKHG